VAFRDVVLKAFENHLASGVVRAGASESGPLSASVVVLGKRRAFCFELDLRDGVIVAKVARRWFQQWPMPELFTEPGARVKSVERMMARRRVQLRLDRPSSEVRASEGAQFEIVRQYVDFLASRRLI
jgi:hypothetical protein